MSRTIGPSDSARVQAEVASLVTSHRPSCPWRVNPSPTHFGVPDVRLPHAQGAAVHAAARALMTAIVPPHAAPDAVAAAAAAAVSQLAAHASEAAASTGSRLKPDAARAAVLHALTAGGSVAGRSVHLTPAQQLSTALVVCGWGLSGSGSRVRLMCSVCGAHSAPSDAMQLQPDVDAPGDADRAVAPMAASSGGGGSSSSLWAIAASAFAAARRAMAAIRGSSSATGGALVLSQPAAAGSGGDGGDPSSTVSLSASASKRRRISAGSSVTVDAEAAADGDTHAGLTGRPTAPLHLVRSHRWWCPWVHPASTGLTVPAVVLDALVLAAAADAPKPPSLAGSSPQQPRVHRAIAALTSAAFGGADAAEFLPARAAATVAGPRDPGAARVRGLATVWQVVGGDGGGHAPVPVTVPGWLLACLSLAACERGVE